MVFAPGGVSPGLAARGSCYSMTLDFEDRLSSSIGDSP